MFPPLTLLHHQTLEVWMYLKTFLRLIALAAMAEDILDFNDSTHLGHSMKIVIKSCSCHIYVKPCLLI